MKRCDSLPVLPSESESSCCYHCLADLDSILKSKKTPKKSSLKVKSVQSESLQHDTDESSSTSKKAAAAAAAAGVSFTSVETREYPNLLGCNPSVSKGSLPLTIGWCPTSTEIQPIDEYEANKAASNRRGTNNVMFLRLTRSKREQTLRRAGYTTNDLEQVLEEITQIQKSREESKQDEVSELKRLMKEARRKKNERVAENKKRRGFRRIMSWSS